MTKFLSGPVVCSVCGKILRSRASVFSGRVVRWHRGLDGKRRCPGEHRTDHQPWKESK